MPTKSTTKSKTSISTKAILSMHDKLITLKNDIDNKWIDLSILASEAYDEDAHTNWINPETKKPYEKLTDFMSVELGLEYRTSKDRIHMGKAIRTLGITKETIDGVGPSHFKELAKLLTKDTSKSEINSLINKAKKMSARELTAYVSKTRVESQGNVQKSEKTTITLQFRDSQAKVWEKGIKEMLNLADLEDTPNNRNIAAEMISSDWQMNRLDPVLSPELKAYSKYRTDEDKKEPKVKHRKHAQTTKSKTKKKVTTSKKKKKTTKAGKKRKS